MSTKRLLDIKNITKLKPFGFWKAFYEINQIPRGSTNMTEISKFIADEFRRLGCEDVHVDKALNIVAHVKATKGLEKLPMLTLQAHMDMVCAKDEKSKHDFLKDPIEMILENGWVHANKTTLGADDGYGIATMIATLTEKIPHGPLEFIVTTDEENGLNGANNFDPTYVRGEYYLNLDGEHEGECTIGSTGGLSHEVTYELIREKTSSKMPLLSLSVRGLKGGHSGVEIHKKRINAIKMLVDILIRSCIINNINIKLVNLDGGEFYNSIPVFASIIFEVEKNKLSEAKENIKKLLIDYKYEYIDDESFISSVREQNKQKWLPISSNQTKKILMGINSSLSGTNVYDLVQSQMDSSTNLGVAITSKDKLKLSYLTRGNTLNAINRIYNFIECSTELSGGTNTFISIYSPWVPHFASNKIAILVKKLYHKLFKKEMKVVSSPGGLEASILLSKCPSLKCAVNFGPDAFGIHTPNEKVSVESIEKFWKLICKIYTSAGELKK